MIGIEVPVCAILRGFLKIMSNFGALCGILHCNYRVPYFEHCIHKILNRGREHPLRWGGVIFSKFQKLLFSSMWKGFKKVLKLPFTTPRKWHYLGGVGTQKTFGDTSENF